MLICKVHLPSYPEILVIKCFPTYQPKFHSWVFHFNIQFLAKNKSSTPRMRNLMKWFGETKEKGIQTSPNRGTYFCISKLCVDTLGKVGGKMILSLECYPWNPSSCSILHFHPNLCPRTESIVHYSHNNVSNLCFVKTPSYNGNNTKSQLMQN